MTAKKTPASIAEFIAACGHRSLVEQAPHVVGQRRDGEITSGRALTERFHHDRVEWPAQLIAEGLWRAVACRADADRRPSLRCAAGEHPRLGAPDRRARSLRLLLADDARLLFGCVGGESERLVAGQELIEQEAERIHVGCRSDRLPEDLL